MNGEREFTFTDDDFGFIAALVYDHMRLNLPVQKKDMVYSRLARRVRQLGLTTFGDYRKTLEQNNDEFDHLINAVTTNVTHFFREPKHFTHLAQIVLPALVRDNAASKRIRIWSAGCSTGMEAYSIAMTIAANLPDWKSWDIKILATDIDTHVLDVGRHGLYDQAHAAKIPPAYAAAFITKTTQGEAIQIVDSIRGLVRFNHLNLFDAWPMRGMFDVLFCRNVVIYFDKETQRGLFDRFATILKPQHWLYIGHSENLHNVTDRFSPVGDTIYQKAD